MSEQKQRTTVLGLTIFMAVLVTLMFLRSYLSAGNLNPSAPPGSTMHTLEEIYNKALSLPSPQDVTIITKSKAPSQVDVWQTIHTVTAGKTFYLMGISYCEQARFYISLDGGLTHHFHFSMPNPPDIPPLRAIAPSYPIAEVSSGTEIKVSTSAIGGGTDPIFITIWGYEISNS